VTIQSGTGLSKDDVEKMVRDAESHAEEDRKKKEEIEARNAADNLCYTAEKTLHDSGDKVSADLKKEVEDKVKELRNLIPTASPEELKQKTNELSLSLQKIGQAMYGAQQQPSGGPQPGGQPGPKTDQGGSGQAKRSKDDKEVKEGEVVS
jgi:molecular chaperone DnaK